MLDNNFTEIFRGFHNRAIIEFFSGKANMHYNSIPFLWLHFFRRIRLNFLINKHFINYYCFNYSFELLNGPYLKIIFSSPDNHILRRYTPK
jgi:hypothetical protein